MKPTRAIAAAAALILLKGAGATLADAAESAPRSRLPNAKATAAQQIEFLADDPEGQRIARMVLVKELARDAERGSELRIIQTAWVRLSASPGRTLLVLHGCSAANCSLDGFERSRSGWRQVLFSLGQRVEMLPSSHEGRRDLSVSMHGDATHSTIKTYWWEKNRYVRVSKRDVTYEP